MWGWRHMGAAGPYDTICTEKRLVIPCLDFFRSLFLHCCATFCAFNFYNSRALSGCFHYSLNICSHVEFSFLFLAESAWTKSRLIIKSMRKNGNYGSLPLPNDLSNQQTAPISVITLDWLSFFWMLCRLLSIRWHEIVLWLANSWIDNGIDKAVTSTLTADFRVLSHCCWNRIGIHILRNL